MVGTLRMRQQLNTKKKLVENSKVSVRTILLCRWKGNKQFRNEFDATK